MSLKSSLLVVYLQLIIILVAGMAKDNNLAMELLDPRDRDMDKAIRNFEQSAAEKLAAEADHVLCYHENIEAFYKDMVAATDAIIDLMKTPNNVYRFLKQKGVERVILSHLTTSHQELKSRLLVLLKTVFDAAPTATAITVPVKAIETIMDIFENDPPPLKAYVLDILNYWLPGNPKLQARLMKRKDVSQLFYQQMSKLDPYTVNHVLLKLFNKILVEHLNARNEWKVKTTTDVLNLEIYKRIGLIEKLSSPKVCRGLLTAFVRSYSADVKDVLPVLELIKNIKPLCMKHYEGNLRALNTFKEYLDYVKHNKFDEDLILPLKEYVEVLQRTILKDEL